MPEFHLTICKAEGYTAETMENEPQVIHREEPRDRTPVSFPGVPQPKKKNVGMKIAILVALLVVIGGIAYVLLSNENPFSPAAPSPTPTVAQVEMPTEAPAPTAPPVSKEDLKLQILNGTGVPGEAALLQKEMEKLGIKIIETANADTKDYTKTEVSFASRVPEEVKTEITTKLQEMYTTVTVSDTAASGVDVKVITGPRKGAAAAKSPTPSVRGASTSKTPTPSKTTGTVTPTGGTVTPTKTPTSAGQ